MISPFSDWASERRENCFEFHFASARGVVAGFGFAVEPCLAGLADLQAGVPFGFCCRQSSGVPPMPCDYSDVASQVIELGSFRQPYFSH